MSRILTVIMSREAFDPFLTEARRGAETWTSACMIDCSHHAHQGGVRFLVGLDAAVRILRDMPVRPDTAPALVHLARAIVAHEYKPEIKPITAWADVAVEEPAPRDENDEHRLGPSDVLDPGYGVRR